MAEDIHIGTPGGLAAHSAPTTQPATPSLRSASPNPPAKVRVEQSSPLPTRIREYFGHVTDVVKTFWEGLSVTLSYMLRRPITVQYPDRTPKRMADMLPPRYRGLLEVDMAVCTGCMACERGCPIEVIKIATDKDPTNPKQRVITQFDIDESKCMFCGLCVEPCPTGAIQHTREFEATMKSIDSLVFRWVPDPEKPVPFYRPVKGQDAPRAPNGEILRKRMSETSWITAPSILVPDGPKKE